MVIETGQQLLHYRLIAKVGESATGRPEQITFPPAGSDDSPTKLVYTQDRDHGGIYELVSKE